MRSTHQDAAKNHVLNNLKSNQVLIIIDWAMKYLPVSFRETQSEWFGEKGRPWHIAAVIAKKDEEFEVSASLLSRQCYQKRKQESKRIASKC